MKISVFVDVDEEVLTRLLAYARQFVNSCCSAGNARESTYDLLNKFVMCEFFVQGSDDFHHILGGSLQQS